MNLTPYKEALSMGKEKLAKALIPAKVNRAKKQAELEMCKLDEEIATKQAEIHELCTGEEVNFPGIIEAQDRLGLLGRKRKQYQKILDEMFPDD